jgi:predicted enzyme related to lactoylglutathione lyase
MRGDTPVGGLMALPEELRAHNVPPHWMMYIGAPTLEEAVSQVERRGGRILSPVIDVPSVGRMQAVTDPQGAAFSVYQPASPPQQPEAAPEIGDVSWHELYTTDGKAAMTFYGEVFGWKPTESMDMGPMGTYYMFGRDLGTIGGMMTKTPEMASIPSSWLLYVRVPDVKAAGERAVANGGKVINGPMEVPGGDLIVQCMDPQGAAFAMHQRKG